MRPTLLLTLLVPILLSACSTAHDTSPEPATLKEQLRHDKGLVIGQRSSARVHVEKAESGDSEAQEKMAISYYLGTGAPADLEQARSWFEKAAENGTARSQYAYSYMLTHGEGGEADHFAALKWASIAALGEGKYAKLAEKERLILSSELSHDEVIKCEEQVADWQSKHPHRKTREQKLKRPY